jgi:hypothetical protein
VWLDCGIYEWERELISALQLELVSALLLAQLNQTGTKWRLSEKHTLGKQNPAVQQGSQAGTQ